VPPPWGLQPADLRLNRQRARAHRQRPRSLGRPRCKPDHAGVDQPAARPGRDAGLPSGYQGSGNPASADSHLIQDGVIRNLEVIGEAINNFSADLRAANPHIPWRQHQELRMHLVDALRLDLIAPGWDHLIRRQEQINQLPSVRYTTGFLVTHVIEQEAGPTTKARWRAVRGLALGVGIAQVSAQAWVATDAAPATAFVFGAVITSWLLILGEWGKILLVVLAILWFVVTQARNLIEIWGWLRPRSKEASQQRLVLVPNPLRIVANRSVPPACDFLFRLTFLHNSVLINAIQSYKA
jgi:hypothetical protein